MPERIGWGGKNQRRVTVALGSADSPAGSAASVAGPPAAWAELPAPSPGACSAARGPAPRRSRPPWPASSVPSFPCRRQPEGPRQALSSRSSHPAGVQRACHRLL